jgi:hypothetical protein
MSILAYVFWHHPLVQTDRSAYEADLLALHSRLKEAGGVIDSVTFAISGVPWANAGGPAYEDWYLVAGWPELGALNTVAVSAERKPPHDGAARGYAAGAGGIYALRRGTNALREAASVQWLAKPRGMPYAGFDAATATAGAHGAVWRRQMVLGPGPEFCITGRTPSALPAPLEALSIARVPIEA